MVLKLTDTFSMTILLRQSIELSLILLWRKMTKNGQILHRVLFTGSNNEKKETENMFLQTICKSICTEFFTDTQSSYISLPLSP